MLFAHIFVIGFGLVVGSFLNVCIHRIPQNSSIIRPGSSCPHCNEPIRPWENIPILSYLFLLGRCSHCREPISWVYPVVEATTALLFYLLFLKYGIRTPFFVNMVFFGMLVALIFIDLFDRLLPNVITFSGLAFGFLTAPLQSSEFFRASPLFAAHGAVLHHYVGSLVGVLVGGGFLWLVAELYLRIRKIEGMGFGDIKMMAMVGAFLGWQFTWLTILLGSLLGAMVGSAFIYLLRKGRRYELPFGSFLGVGAVISTLWGGTILVWFFG